jgi:NTE family protein
MNCDLVCEGGGTKIPGLVGALATLEKRGFTPVCLAGSSAGAIVAAMCAAGYTAEEMHVILDELDFKTFKDGAPWGTKLLNLRRWMGMYRGDVFQRLMRRFMLDKGVVVFGDLKNAGETDPRRKYKLNVFASDITNSTLVSWPTDATYYGLDPDLISVAWAVRMSMSIPFFFRPVKVNGSFLVDGGVISNFPIGHFDSHTAPRWPTFGLLLSEANNGQPNKITGLVSFGLALVKTWMESHDKQFVRTDDYKYRTIRIPVGDASGTNFDIKPEQKKWLYDSGVFSASRFLTDWRWEDYLEWAKRVRGAE